MPWVKRWSRPRTARSMAGGESRSGRKNRWPKGREGSTPSSPTMCCRATHPLDVRAASYSRIDSSLREEFDGAGQTSLAVFTRQLAQAVRTSRSLRQVLAKLGLSQQGGGAYATLHRRIKELGLETGHLTGQGWNVGNASGNLRSGAIPLDLLLTRDSPCTNFGRLKRRLVVDGLLRNRCYICGLGPVWRDRELVLRLDHINGRREDNRLENLRMVCPNCDSQLPTFAGRNRGRMPGPADSINASGTLK